MLRVTTDVLEVRRMADLHGLHPCRDEETGALTLARPGERCAVDVGWDEWEPAFRAARCVLVYDDAPGLQAAFVGDADAAQDWMMRSLGREARPEAP